MAIVITLLLGLLKLWLTKLKSGIFFPPYLGTVWQNIFLSDYSYNMIMELKLLFGKDYLL